MITIEKLNGLQRIEIAEHLKKMTNEDLALRFGYYVSPERLEQYSENVNFNRDIVLGAYNPSRELVGFCHCVAGFSNGIAVADVGISVIGDQRGQGIGLRLLQASFDMAANRGIAKLHIYTLRRNTPMRKLMKKLGGEINIEDDDVTMSFDLKEIHESEKMEHYISKDGIEYIKKIVNSNSKTILFVHGAGGDAWQWRTYFMPYFASKNINSIAISLPNHGQSKKDNSYELLDYITFIKKAHEETGTNTVLIGHSSGGFLLQQYAAIYGIEEKIILLASMPPFEPSNLDGNFISLVSEHLTDKQAQNHLHHLLSNAESIDKYKIKSEIVLIAGEKDNVIPIQWEEKMSRHYSAKLYTVDCGHNLMLGKNWENVAALLEKEIE